MSKIMVEPLEFNSPKDESSQKKDLMIETTSPYDLKARSSYQIDMFVKNVRKDYDYFANDDSVIRSPTYYTRTTIDLTEKQSKPTDLKQLLQPCNPDENREHESVVPSTRPETEILGEDDAMEFEKKIEDHINKSDQGSSKIRKSTLRKPEDVKFRTIDEERAS